jgi:hypothetical protein
MTDGKAPLSLLIWVVMNDLNSRIIAETNALAAEYRQKFGPPVDPVGCRVHRSPDGGSRV